MKEDPNAGSKKKALKLKNPNTRGKNAAGQTNGQFERNTKSGSGQFTGAGEAPRMTK